MKLLALGLSISLKCALLLLVCNVWDKASWTVGLSIATTQLRRTRGSSLLLGAGNSDDIRPSTVVTGVTLKVAVDSTGAAADLAEDKSERFTCGDALDMVHRLRRDSSAVLVGKGTVRVDNPSLTVRRIPCDEQPVRVVIDPRLELLLESKADYTLFGDSLPTIVYHSRVLEDLESLELPESVTLVFLKPKARPSEDGKVVKDYISPTEVVADLESNQKVRHLMVEGGPMTALQFLTDERVDRALIVRANLCFRKPLPSGLSDEVLQSAGLVKLGTRACGVDEIDYWSRPDVPWPSEEDLTRWP